MSSEQGEDSHAIWQDNNMSWDQSFEGDPRVPNAPPDSPGPYYDDEEAGLPDSQEYAQDEEDEDLSNPSLLSWESLQQIGRRFSFVIVPLLFALVIWIITLPFTLSDTPTPRVSFLPMILLLVALAVAQGTALYFAGPNDSLWLLSVIVGFCIFVLLGSYVIFGPGFSIFLFLVLLVLGVVMARRSIRPVPEGRVDIVHSFGKYKRTLFPGFNLILPWEHVSSELNVRETIWTCPKQTIHLLNDQQVELLATLSYQLLPEDAYLAVFHVKDWENSLYNLFLTTIHHDVHELSPEDFIAPHRKSNLVSMPDPPIVRLWDSIGTRLWQHMQDQVAPWGVQINWVQIRELHLLPHVPPKVDMAAGMARPINVGAIRGAAQPPTQPAPANVFSNQQFGRSHLAQPGPAAAAAPVNHPQPTPTSAPAASAFLEANNDALIDIYEAVRNGLITDPESIRELAQRFLTIANDPEANKDFPFDAERAAHTLFQRAKWYEDQARAGNIYETSTQHEMPRPRRANENLMAGG